jgi:hypothetical protein
MHVNIILNQAFEVSPLLVDYASSGATTRSADKISIATSSITGWDDEVGTFLAVVEGPFAYGAYILGGYQTETPIYSGGSTFQSWNGSTNLAAPVGNPTVAGVHKIASAGDASGRSIVSDGNTVGTDANVFISTDIVDLYIGSRFDSTGAIFGSIKSLTYYPTRLSNDALVGLTS